MPTTRPCPILQRPAGVRGRPRHGERGNIVLICALILVSLGMAGIGISNYVRGRLEEGALLRYNNFPGTLAQLAAESVLNYYVRRFNTGDATESSLVTPISIPFPDTRMGPNFTTQYSSTFTASTPQVMVSVSVDAPAHEFTLTANAVVTGTDPAGKTLTFSRRRVAHLKLVQNQWQVVSFGDGNP